MELLKFRGIKVLNKETNNKSKNKKKWYCKNDKPRTKI